MSVSPRAPLVAVTAVMAFVLAVALAPRSGQAELAKWDQERVTRLAVDLAVAVKDTREQVRKVPGQSYGSLQEKSRTRLMDTLRVLKNEARHLASELQAGASREDTLPIYERLGQLVADARENAKRILLPEPVLAELTTAGVVWSQLGPYYDPDWDAKPSPSEAE